MLLEAEEKRNREADDLHQRRYAQNMSHSPKLHVTKEQFLILGSATMSKV